MRVECMLAFHAVSTYVDVAIVYCGVSTQQNHRQHGHERQNEHGNNVLSVEAYKGQRVAF